MAKQEHHPPSPAKNRRLALIHRLIVGVVILTTLGIAISAILIVSSQGVTQALITLTIISIVAGMIIGLLTLMVNAFQWLSTHNASSTPEHTAPISPLVEQQNAALVATSSIQTQTPFRSLAGLATRVLPLTDDQSPSASAQDQRLEEWGEAPQIINFYGRDAEHDRLEKWLTIDRCKVIALLGIGGIGKSSLAAKLAEKVKDNFQYIYWRTLQNAPLPEDFLKDCLYFLSHYQAIDLPTERDAQVSLLLHYLREHRCLLILDNIETILESGIIAGEYKRGYEAYGQLIRQFGEAKHESCLLLTSREKPREIAQLEGLTSPVRVLQLGGLQQADGEQLLKDKGLFGSDETLQRMVQLYSGNPLSLQLAAEPIQSVFGGNISSFLQKGRALLGDIRNPLDLQFMRLSPLERSIMYWLAIGREGASPEDLQSDMLESVSDERLIGALNSLRRRFLIEVNEASLFILQPVITEYITDKLIEQSYREFVDQAPDLLSNYALVKAQSKDYIRDSQIRVILKPLSERLISTYSRAQIEVKSKEILHNHTRQNSQDLEKSYTGGNLLNLLLFLQFDLRGYDFSFLPIWQAYLQNVILTDVNFSHSNLAKSVFTETFAGILSLAISADGECLAAGGTNGEIRLWRVKDGVPLATCKGHIGWVYGIAISPDSKLLASGSEDQTIRIWNMQTGQWIKTLRGHTGRIWSVAFAPDNRQLISGSHDHSVRVWDLQTGTCLKELNGESGRIWSVAISSDGKTIASGGDALCLWETSTGELLFKRNDHTNPLRSVAFRPNSNEVASGSDDQTIRIWSRETGNCLATLSDHTSRIRSVAFSATGQFLASGGDDQTVRLWECATWQPLKTFSDHAYWVGSVAFSPDELLLASGSEDQTVRLWEISTGLCLKMFRGYAHHFESVTFHSDSTLLVSGGNDKTVRIWNIDTGKCQKVLYGHTDPVRAVSVSQDGQFLASGSSDQTVRLWNSKTGKCIHVLTGHNHKVWSVAFSPDGKTVASSSEDEMVRLWDTATGECFLTLQSNAQWIWSVAFSPDGKTLATGNSDQTVHLWDLQSGERLKILHRHNSRVWSVAFSPDSKFLASGSEDQTIYLWDLETGEPVAHMQGHTGLVRSVAFHPEGALLASGSDDQTARIWEVHGGKLLLTLTDHTNQVRSVAFNQASGSHLLASCSHDSTIRLWNSQTGECLKILAIDRPYERMDITSVSGLTEAQKMMLKALGAIEREE
jgi:WD40 repeat protein